MSSDVMLRLEKAAAVPKASICPGRWGEGLLTALAL